MNLFPPADQNDQSANASTRLTAMACREIADLQTQIAYTQKQMLTAIDPEMRVGQLNSASERADATVARINELEQQLKAAKAVASDAGGDKLIELITESAEANKPIDARLKALANKPSSSCVIA